MRLLVIADIEDLRWKHGVGEADILLSCGDVSDHVIMEAADAFKCHAIFAVKGNHDSADPFPEPIVDLHRSSKKCLDVTWIRRFDPPPYVMFYFQKKLGRICANEESNSFTALSKLS